MQTILFLTETVKETAIVRGFLVDGKWDCELSTKDNELVCTYFTSTKEHDSFPVPSNAKLVNGMLTWTIDAGSKLQRFTILFR